MTEQRLERIHSVLENRQPDLTIVMENVHDPHNISAVLRTADSVGMQDLYVLNTSTREPVAFGRRSSSSARNWLTVHQFIDTDECVQALKEKGFKLMATHLGEQALSLYEMDLTEPVALVFGNEHDGVTDELLKHCDGNFIIPQMGMVKSLNISVACAVTLYEAFRQRQEKGLYRRNDRLDKGYSKQLFDKWTEVRRKR